ncbi:hypothetical protein KP509_04G095400 [Ceratopteris richardii]|uniref:Two-component response regulator n=1 Tax=Ceratopteris richardii TaxID=49495 RepID=A0A8T2UZP0_CERRI|nr:hypothetical protein KP509_04G095400 [Ceratopteris richardii]
MGAETGVPYVGVHTPKKNMGSGSIKENNFPAGLRVLVVDDDRICLLILDRLLQQCLYKVTTCERAVDALKILRENKDGFDVVISDVHMPDMDGYKLLEHVGLEMDLPVIMMSSNSETSAVMRGIKHGACDYLLKPVRLEELKNIWQHVVRRKKKDSDGEERLKPDDGGDRAPLEGSDGASKSTKKRKENVDEDEETEPENDDPATSKKPRVVWTVELHQKFVTAVNSLGIDKAVPKRILELMDVKHLTRENVASHLQKYRLYLKRLSGVAYQGSGLGTSLFGTSDERFMSTRAGSIGDFRSHFPSHAIPSSLHSRFLDGVTRSSADPLFLGQLANNIRGLGSSPTGNPPYALPLLNSPSALGPSVSSGLDLICTNNRVGGQGYSLAPGGKLSDFPTSLGANAGRLANQERYIPDDHKNNLVMQILKQHQGVTKMTDKFIQEAERSTAHYTEKMNSRSNALDSSCKSDSEIVALGNFSHEVSAGLDQAQKISTDVISYDPMQGMGITSDKLSSTSVLVSSSMVHSSLPHGTNQSSKIELAGLQSILLEDADNRNAFQFCSDATNSWQSYNLNHYSAEQKVTSHAGSKLNHSAVSLGQTPSFVNYMHEHQTGWIPGFQGGFVEDIHGKPHAFGTPPHFEATYGEREMLDEVSLDSLVVSKVGTSIDAFPLQEDLLSCYMKQQQQDILSLSGNDATEGYSLGNTYVK